MTNELSVEEAVELLKEKRMEINYQVNGTTRFSKALDIAIKSLEQQPKTGRWINGNPICPCCGEDKFKDLDADIWADWQPKYCPNCGAKMEVEE